jgi:peptide/nickel transport system permease protein
VRAYIGRKVLFAAVTLFIVLSFDFVLFRMVPDNPLDVLAQFSGTSDVDKVAELTREHALDRPIFPDQYVVFLRQMLTLDLGEEFSEGVPAWSLIARFALPTVVLVGGATALAAVIGVAAGIVGGWRRAGVVDRGATAVSVLAMSTPPFVLAMLLVSVLGPGMLGWFPGSGSRGVVDVEGLAWAADRWNHAFLPLLTLTVAAVGPFYLVMRESMVDVLGEDYLTVARAKGVGEHRVRMRHAVRTALLPVTTLLAFTLGIVLMGSIAVEYVFGYPGLGLLMVVSMTTRNFPVLQGIFLLFTAMMLIANLIADIAYGSLDPRVRYT